MSKKRFLVAAGGVVLVFALGTGLSTAQTSSTSPTTSTTTIDHDAMHQQMRAQMPEGMQAQCDTMHAQMGAGHMGTMQQGGMGSNGMMGSGGMMGSTSGS